MKSYTFFIEEYDQQAGLMKYYKIHRQGKSANHAYSIALKYMIGKFSGSAWRDYHHKLLTLNEYNALHR
jgi:hypothetical protein